MKKSLIELEQLAYGMTILCVEDNDNFREHAYELLKKIFHTVYIACDGAEGYDSYNTNKPDIILTGNNMPKMSGLELSRKIHESDPGVKIIITSAHDEKELLYSAIGTGVFAYLKKPLRAATLATTLYRCIKQIHEGESSALAQEYLHDVYLYDDNLVVMFEDDHPVFANRGFFDFFGVENIAEFLEKNPDFGALLMEHSGFLYGISWFETLKQELDKLFHVKIWDTSQQSHHFVLKSHPVPEKPHKTIISLKDITELNLMALFDMDSVKKEDGLRDKATLLGLLHTLKHNGAKIKVHNFYKGLSIANSGVIHEVTDTHIVVKTSAMQQKAVQVEKVMILASDALPADVMCARIDHINLHDRTVECNESYFLDRSPTERKSIRIQPEESHKVTLFYEERSLRGDVRVVDISVDAAKLQINTLPAGLKAESKVRVDMVFAADKKPVIINTDAEVFSIRLMKHCCEIIIMLNLSAEHKRPLVHYIADRQMVLIREFKWLKYPK